MTDPQGLPCVGRPPELFDDTWAVGLALSLCADCPARAWCLDRVDPARSHYDGVAGGVRWSNGRPKVEGTPAPELEEYLQRAAPAVAREILAATPTAARRHQHGVNPAAVAQFLEGEIPWSSCTAEERQLAARHLFAAGRLTRVEIAARCRISSRLLREAERGIAS